MDSRHPWNDEEQALLFEKLYQHAHDAIFLVDPVKECVVDGNPAAERLLGYSRTELRGLSVAAVHPNEMAKLRWFLKHLAEEGSGWTDELTCRTRAGRILSAEITAFLVTLADERYVVSMVRDITARKRREAEIHHLATHDPLTNLPNRTLFMDRVEQALHRQRRNTSCMAVLWVDLDDFKAINDRHGHFIGDAVLVEVAGLLTRTFRAADSVARFGGDEFTVLLEHAEAPPDVERAARRLLDALRRPLHIAARRLTCRASIGMTLARAEGDLAEAMLRRADRAARRAKRERRGDCVWFESTSAEADNS